MLQREFCHLKITDISFKELMEVIDQHVKERKFLSITRLTLSMLIKSMFNSKLKEALREIDIVIPSSRFLHTLIRKTYPRYQFQLEDTKEVMLPLIKEYHQFPINFLFLGGTLEGLNRFSINLKATFPGLKIVGIYPKIFLERKEEDIKTIIRKTEPHVFFAGIGEGHEEIWLRENKSLIPKSVAICISKQLDIICEVEKDIPYSYKVTNKEFFYLLRKKPYRIFDVFAWAFTWIKWKLFDRKLKKQN